MDGQGFAFWRQFPQWVKGPAHLEGEEIVLDENRAETYYIHGPEDLVFDLTTLSPLRPNYKTQDVVRFVRRHGLLWHGPEAIGSGECRESLRDLGVAGSKLRFIVIFHKRLMEAVETGSTEPLRSLRLVHEPAFDVVNRVLSQATNDDEYLVRASMVLAELMSERLAGCREGIAAACAFQGADGDPMGGPGVFMYDVRPPNLEAAAYSHLARLIVSRAELRDCPGCGRTFVPKSRKQKYCTPRCASTTRGQRFRERHQAEKTQG